MSNTLGPNVTVSYEEYELVPQAPLSQGRRDGSRRSKCEFCGGVFIPARREQIKRADGEQRFCSKGCFFNSIRRPECCVVSGCDRPCVGQGMCGGHYARVRRLGDPQADKPLRRRSRKGVTKQNGYLYLHRPLHPNARGSNGTLAVHRFVMSEMLGRPLLSTEQVHHKNGRRDDNRPENLELRIGNHGTGATVEDRVRDAQQLLETYAPRLLAHAQPLWHFDELVDP